MVMGYLIDWWVWHRVLTDAEIRRLALGYPVAP